MSFFKSILKDRYYDNHDGRPLWKYSLTEFEYSELKKHLFETRSSFNLDYRDCALYYSEWWKRSYNGGLPSKKEVFNSIANIQFFDDEEFYKYAKKGASLLGIRWIKNQNTLYFKTLLLQGGLPIKHLSNNKGAYKNFLLEILKLNPRSIDDFAFDPRVTSLLPLSSRNDEIYECCLDVVKAIINDDNEYLSILDSSEELKEIGNYLRINKPKIRPNPTKTKYKTNWVYESSTEKIRLYFRISEVIEINDFRETFLKSSSNEELDYEYTLFYNDLVLCKFSKRANNTFRTIWINNRSIYWDGTDNFPEIKIISSNGEKINCKELINYLPTFIKPTLWTKYSEGQWILEKGCNTNQIEAYIIYAQDYFSENNQFEEINVCGRILNMIAFKDVITISNKITSITFKAGTSKIEWYIVDEKPKWMQRANMVVVRSRPKIFVYDERDNLISKPEIHWRQSKYPIWNSFTGPIPLGLIEIQIQALNVSESDTFFNIGNLELETPSSNLQEAEIQLLNNPFEFNIYENPFIQIHRKTDTKIQINLTSKTNIPDSIHASLKITNQLKSLSFEIHPPFKGFEIIDNNQNIIENNSIINLNSIYGYRIMSNQENLIVNMYNSKLKGIIISEKITEKFIPLRTYEDRINQLFRLSDSMENDVEINIEILEEKFFKQNKIKEYRIKRYNFTAEATFNSSEKLEIRIKTENADLLAIPLDCNEEQIELHNLEHKDDYYFIKNNLDIDKFIIINNKESSIKIQPAFVSHNPNNIPTNPEDRKQRVLDLANLLLENNYEHESWQKLLKYYNICQNQDLLFSTFDILRAISFSSEIAAKSFVFLASYDEVQKFIDEYCSKMEDDIGFSFHWVSKKHWEIAMEWIGCFTNPDFFTSVSEKIKNYFDNLYPSNQFEVIKKYVVQDIKPGLMNDFHLNGKINELRSSLGDKVLSQLPQISPKVPERYKEIIPVNETTANVKVLLKSPLAVALSIAGIDDALWKSNKEEVRRYIKYSQQLNPEWYSEAIHFCLTKI